MINQVTFIILVHFGLIWQLWCTVVFLIALQIVAEFATAMIPALTGFFSTTTAAEALGYGSALRIRLEILYTFVKSHENVCLKTFRLLQPVCCSQTETHSFL